MNSGKKVAPVSAVIADHELTNALQRCARIMREVGNEPGVSWALETIRSIDPQAAEKARAKAFGADVEAGLALQDYILTVKEQARTAHVAVAEAALRKLHRNNYAAVYLAIETLEYNLNARIDAVVADKKKK